MQRTGQLVLVNTPIVARLAASDPLPFGARGYGLYAPFQGGNIIPIVQQR